MKKVLIIGGSVIGIILLGVVGYYVAVLLIQKNPATDGTAPTPATGNIASENQSPITPLGDAPILTYFVQSDGITALQSTGEVIELKNGKAPLALSSAKLVSLVSASFSADGKKILAKFGTLKEYHYSMFDRQSQLWVGLSNDKVEAADWSPDTHEVVYLEKVLSGSNIVVLDTDKLRDSKKPELGFAKTVVGFLNELDSDITWLNKNEVLISPKPARYVPSTILRYKIKEKVFLPVITNVLGATFNWDKPSGLGLGYLFAIQKGAVVLVDASGVTRGEMGFVTMPEKCTISGGYLYCAIPDDLKGATLPDDYLMKAIFFRDNFYRVSLTDGKTEALLQDTGGDFDAQMMRVSQGKIYFINNLDGRLYQFTMAVK